MIKKSICFDIEFQLRTLDKLTGNTCIVYDKLYRKDIREPIELSYPLYINYDLNRKYDSNAFFNEKDIIANTFGEVVIDSKTILNPRSNISRVPTCSQHAIKLIELIIDHHQYNNNPHKEAYFGDIFNLSNDEHLLDENIKTFAYVEDIIGNFYKTNDHNFIDTLTATLFCDILDNVIEFMDEDKEAYYTLNTDRKDLILTRNDDVRIIRYELNKEALEIKKEIESEFS